MPDGVMGHVMDMDMSDGIDAVSSHLVSCAAGVIMCGTGNACWRGRG